MDDASGAFVLTAHFRWERRWPHIIKKMKGEIATSASSPRNDRLNDCHCEGRRPAALSPFIFAHNYISRFSFFYPPFSVGFTFPLLSCGFKKGERHGMIQTLKIQTGKLLDFRKAIH